MIMYNDPDIRIEEHPTEIGGYSLYIRKRFFMLPDGVLEDLAKDVGGKSLMMKLDALNPSIPFAASQISTFRLHEAFKKAYAKYEDELKEYLKQNKFKT